jgi:hypothetical protein
MSLDNTIQIIYEYNIPHGSQHLHSITRQAMYALYEACSCDHCCNGTAISITYSEYVHVALDILHAVHVHHIVIYGLSHSTVFFHIVS